jgi:hypothetical protein
MREAEERVGDYREKAARLRDLAQQTRYPECRRELLVLAESFDKLADIRRHST